MKISERLPVNLTMHKHEREVADAEYRYLVQRRDEFSQKIRFGTLALNAGSLIALLGLVGGEGSAAIWLGFTKEIVLYSAIAFTVGLIFSGISINAQQNLMMKESGDAAQKAISLNGLVARYDGEHNEENNAEYGKHMNAYHEMPLTGFQYSNLAIWCQNFAGGAWLAGILMPLGNALF